LRPECVTRYERGGLPWIHHNKIHIVNTPPLHGFHKACMIFYCCFTFGILHGILPSQHRETMSFATIE
jgi:hypothetical protein